MRAVPTLVCDDVVAALARGGPSVPVLDTRYAQRLRDEASRIVRTGRRFAFDYESTRVGSKSSGSDVDLFRGALLRARLPFPKIVLDYDVQGFLDGGPDMRPKSKEAPDRAACFVESLSPSRSRLTPFGVSSYGVIQVGPVSVEWDLESRLPPSRDLPWLMKALRHATEKTGLSLIDPSRGRVQFSPAEIGKIDYEALMRSCLVGYTPGLFAGITDYADEEHRYRSLQTASLVLHARHVLTPTTATEYRTLLDSGNGQAAYVVGGTINSFSGQWRMVVALIALLNAQDFTSEYSFRAGVGSRIIGGKITPYLEHRWISLKIPAAVVLRESTHRDAEAIPKRRHQVRGHWMHRRGVGDPACRHAFVNVTENRQRCALCDYDRWWRPDHERGDASIGYVTKDYVVEGGQ